MARSAWRRRHLALNERGATAVEYALVVGLVSLVVIAGPVGLGAAFVEYADGLVTQLAGLLGV